MSRHSESQVSAVKQAIDLINLVSEYGLTVHRAGSKFKALCPFHDDHRPSLDLNPERQSFKCWACGAGGDIFDFVQRIERIEFPEALRMLAERAGIALQNESKPGETEGPTKSELREACEWALGQFRAALDRSTQAADYVAKRGLSAETVERFQMGYAPDERDWLLHRSRREGIDPSRLELVGLVARNDEGTLTRDRFRGRLIFPIHDWQGRCVGFGGRILPEAEKHANDNGIQLAKYINSPETPLFQKRRHLYGVHLARDEARRAGWVAVVEGYTDVIAAHQAGLTNVVGTLGTALGEDHVMLLKRLAERVVLVFDGDEAGQKAAERALESFLGHDVDMRVLVLPAGLDPCDFLLKEGAEPFRAMVEASVDPLQFALDRAATRFDFSSSEGTRQAAEWLLTLLARVPAATRQGLDLKLAKSLDTIAQRLRVPVGPLQKRLKTLRRQAARVQAPARESNMAEELAQTEPAVPDVHQIDPLEAELVRVVLNEPALLARLAERLTPEQIHEPSLREIFEACLATRGDGLEPSFENVTGRLNAGLRSLAAGLLLPFEPQPTSKWVPPAGSWSDRLDGALRQWSERLWQAELAQLERRMAEIDRASRPDEYATLRRAYLQLHHQRPDTRIAPAS